MLGICITNQSFSYTKSKAPVALIYSWNKMFFLWMLVMATQITKVLISHLNWLQTIHTILFFYIHVHIWASSHLWFFLWFLSPHSFYKQLKVLAAHLAMYWNQKMLFHSGFHKPYAGKYLQLGKDKIRQNCCFKYLNVFHPVSKGEMFSQNSVIFWWIVILTVSGKYQHLSFSKSKNIF